MNFAQISEHLSHFRVGIAGAGGLGSNCAVSLARCGIGTLVIADFDVVEQNNLNRQYFFTDQIGLMKVIALKDNIFRINPLVSVIVHPKKLDETNIAEIFQGCDVVVEAFDNSENKELLIETLDKCMPLTPLVIASGLAGWGNNDALKFRKIDETLFVCGDELSEISEELPPMAPRVGIVANMQANAVVEILMQKNR
jgi:sulfur carrier protein ThiS adenylyltransferase